VNIVGGSLNQSQNIHDTMRDAWESTNAPTYLIKEERRDPDHAENKAIIRPLTASQKSVRGPHPPTLLLDEIDEMDQDILDAASASRCRRSTGWGEHRSSPDHDVLAPGSTRTRPSRRCTGVTRRRTCRSTPGATGDLQPHRWLAGPGDFIEEKKRQIPAEMWRVEYELGEPSIGNRAFDSDAVERMFSLSTEDHQREDLQGRQEYRFEDASAGPSTSSGRTGPSPRTGR
jgi:hypothetical protein